MWQIVRGVVREYEGEKERLAKRVDMLVEQMKVIMQFQKDLGRSFGENVDENDMDSKSGSSLLPDALKKLQRQNRNLNE